MGKQDAKGDSYAESGRRSRREMVMDKEAHVRNESAGRRRRRRRWKRPSGKPIRAPRQKSLEPVVSHLRDLPSVPLGPLADDGTLAYCKFKSRRDGDVEWRLVRVQSCGRVTATVQFFDTGEMMTRVWVTSMVRILYQ
jgi:hypothetical protein